MTTADATIPMQSVRIGEGVYEVVGTSRDCVVQRAYRQRERVQIGHGLNDYVADGWHVIVDGEWSQWFATKREALQACRRNPEL